jgi:hypothetical protein
LTQTICAFLKGFPTALKSETAFPFGIWFASNNVLYVADEGNGDNTFSSTTQQYTVAAAQTTAGLQKWIFDSGTQTWNLAYTLRNGLALGIPYSIPGYQTGTNSSTGLPWASATDGLRNITGTVSSDGTAATIYAITSTVSGNGDQGSDPNKLVAITDNWQPPLCRAPKLSKTLRAAGNLEVLRGVSYAPRELAEVRSRQFEQKRTRRRTVGLRRSGARIDSSLSQTLRIRASWPSMGQRQNAAHSYRGTHP